MPAFANGITGLVPSKKLTASELIRCIRQLISTEQEAVSQYEQLAESTDNLLAKKIFQDIADEEKVHIGELMTLLLKLTPREAQFYAKGQQEVQAQKNFKPTGQ